MKKGQVLVIVMILISLFITIIISLSAVMLADQINQRRVNNSAAAYYLAETALERGILDYKNRMTGTNSITQILINENITGTAIYSWKNQGQEIIFTGKGETGGITRILKTAIDELPGASPPNTEILIKPKYWLETYEQ